MLYPKQISFESNKKLDKSKKYSFYQNAYRK